MRSAITRDIAVAVNEQEKPVSQSLSTAEASAKHSFKCQLHATHVGAVGWGPHRSSPTTCEWKADHKFVFWKYRTKLFYCKKTTLHSKFLEILKFVFFFEVAHMQEPIMGSWQMSFWVKFSGLMSQLKILQKSRIQVREYSTYRFIFVLYLRLNKILCCTDEAFQIILLKSHNRHCFFLAVDNKKFQRAIASATACGTNEYPPDDWLKTG